MVYKMLAIYIRIERLNRIGNAFRPRNEQVPESPSLTRWLGNYAHNNPLRWLLVTLE